MEWTSEVERLGRAKQSQKGSFHRRLMMIHTLTCLLLGLAPLRVLDNGHTDHCFDLYHSH